MNRRRLLILFFGILCLSQEVWSQEEIPFDANQKLGVMGLEILSPVDSKDKLLYRKKSSNSFANEDLLLSRGNTDIMIFLYPFESMKFDYPHFEFNRIITHLASNDPNDLIFSYSLPENPLVDWSGEVRFKVKGKVSSRNFATAQGFFRDKVGLYIVVYMDSKLQTDFQKVMDFVDVLEERQE